jgi:hypothetical protein
MRMGKMKMKLYGLEIRNAHKIKVEGWARQKYRVQLQRAADGSAGNANQKSSEVRGRWVLPTVQYGTIPGVSTHA